MTRGFATAAFALVGLAVSATLCPAQELYTLRAPIDGTVRKVSQIGSRLSGGVSSAQEKYDEIRDGHQIPRAYLTSGRAISPDTVAFIASDLLELQLIQETARLNAAGERYALADSAYALERRLRFKEESVRVQQNQVDLLYIEEDLARNPRAPAWRERLTLHGKGLSGDKVDLFRERQKHALDQELPKGLTIAQAELAAAQWSVRILEATAALGSMVCPTECVVREVLVLPGQYVTKGDPVVVIEARREEE